MTRPRVLGTCYVCGRACFGYRAVAVTELGRHKGKVVVRDVNGIRHGGCDATLRKAHRATLSDA